MNEDKITYKNLQVERATTKIYELYFKEDGSTIDITDWTVYFTVKEKITDTDANAKIDKKITTHTMPINGETEIELTSSDTNLTAGDYIYGIDIKDDEGETIPLMRGRFLIVEPIRSMKD